MTTLIIMRSCNTWSLTNFLNTSQIWHFSTLYGNLAFFHFVRNLAVKIRTTDPIIVKFACHCDVLDTM